MTVPLILASSSPRRRELLGLLGLSPEVVPADIDESWRNGEAPPEHVERLAREKAAVVGRAGAAVVAADTIVEIDGEIVGKPVDEVGAAAMLRRLSGREHQVHTAVAVAFEGRTACAVESTRVSFLPLDETTIAAYVATGEPMDKAGAYGIQGYGAVLVERIAGDYFTIMGLALGRMVVLLREVGLVYRFGALTRA
ncbi:MAG: septum formation inhibitor Maf [Gemmatimonadetes bacterium]|nr:septum formation inhibitor Maf [Gemmatimonadota bacterium]